jgi:hypothetical protein
MNNFDIILENYKKYELELAHLGDLSKFSFAELSKQLPQFNNSVENFGSYFVASFESAYTILSIRYTIDGKFVRIVDQYWK